MDTTNIKNMFKNKVLSGGLTNEYIKKLSNHLTNMHGITEIGDYNIYGVRVVANEEYSDENFDQKEKDVKEINEKINDLVSLYKLRDQINLSEAKSEYNKIVSKLKENTAKKADVENAYNWFNSLYPNLTQ